MSRRKPSDEAQVGVGVDEELDVELRPQLGFDEDQDPLHEDDRRGHDVDGLRCARVVGEVVDGYLCRQALPQELQVLDQQ